MQARFTLPHLIECIFEVKYLHMFNAATCTPILQFTNKEWLHHFEGPQGNLEVWILLQKPFIQINLSRHDKNGLMIRS